MKCFIFNGKCMKKNKNLKELEQKLEKALIKKASYGNFNEVFSSEDLSENAKMIGELLELPKYDQLIRKLQLTSGVINFVTNKGYEPLIELLMKKAFPSDSNATFSMGNEFSLPSDHYVDARDFFPKKPGPAIEKLEGVLKGTPKKFDRSYLVENGIDESTFKQYLDLAFGGSSDASAAEMANMPQPSEVFDNYVNQKAALKESPIYRELSKNYKRFQQHNKAVVYNQLNKEKIDTGEKKPKPTLSQEQVRQLRVDIKNKRSMYLQALQSIEKNPAYDILTIKDSAYSGKSERNTDGFTSWSPAEKILQACVKTIKAANGSLPAFDQEVYSFSQLLEDFETNDKALNEFIVKTVDFLQKDETPAKIYSNIEIMHNIRRRLMDLTENNGQTLIVSNVDNSPFAMKSPQTGKVSLEVDGVLDDFAAMNSSREIKERSKGGGANKKKMILMSAKPLENLPKGSTTINFNTQTIDKDEAKVIVKNLLLPYAKKAQIISFSKGKKEIGDRLGSLNSPEAKKEVDNLKYKIQKLSRVLGNIPEEERSKLEDLIVGMDHKSGIRRVQNAITMNVTVEYDEEGNTESLSLDGDQIMEDLLEEYNNEGLEGVKGMVIVKNTCTWDEYIKVEDSMWGGYCGRIFGAVEEKKWAKERVKVARERLLELKRYLKMGHSNKTRNDLVKEYKAVQSALNKALEVSERSSEAIAPYTILYGDPGSGKTVFPEALSDLLGYKYVRELRLGDQKSKWYGESNENLQVLLDKIFEAKNTVFRIDEVEKQIGMSKDNAGEEQMHEATAGLMAKLQEAFGSEEGMKRLRDNNVHITMSTNFPENIAQAWFQRTKGSVYSVPKPNSPENIKTFILKFIDKKQRQNPDEPLFWAMEGTNEEKWEETNRIVQSLDLDKISQTFTKSDVSFRTLEGFVEDIFAMQNRFNLQMDAVSRGDSDQVNGMPINTENVQAAASFAKDTGENVEYTIGTQQVELAVTTKMNQFLKTHEFETVEETDPITGESVIKRVIPEELMELAKYQDSSEDWESAIDESQFDVVEQDGQPSLVPTDSEINQEFQNLEDTSFDEDIDDFEVEPEATENPDITEDSDDENENTVNSSTDYYYQTLKKMGLLEPKKSGKDISDIRNKNIKEAQETEQVENKEVNFYDELAPHGVAYFSPRGSKDQKNYIPVMPKSKKTRPHKF